MPRLRGLLLIACLALPLGLLSGGEGTRPPTAESASGARIARLIAQLGSEQFAAREEATQALDSLGEPALDALREAATAHADAEVRRRSQGLVRLIEARSLAARAFARQVLHLIQVVSKESVTEASPRELTAWAIEGLYQGLPEKIPPRITERLGRAKELREGEGKELLREARLPLDRFPELHDDKDFSKAVKAMLARCDPHARLIGENDRPPGPERPAVSIGVRLEIDAAAKLPRVLTPVKDSPAYKAGIQAGDLIVRVERRVDRDGQPLPQPQALATAGLPLEVVQRALLGQAGTPLRLTIQRAGVAKPRALDVPCGWVEAETVLGLRRKPDDSWDHLIDPANGIGYVRVTAFGRNTARDLTRTLDALTQAGLQGLVFDLRANPGGLFQAAIDVADLFIDDGTIALLHPRKGEAVVYAGKKEGSRLDFPLVTLIDRDSVGGSEIVAACLQDHKRAVLAGERSHGKASAQTVTTFTGNATLNDHWELCLTSGVFLRPNGRKLDKIRLPGRGEDEWGVTPDRGFALELPPKERAALLQQLNHLEIIPPRDLPTKEASAFKDRQRERAVEHLRAQIRKSSRPPE